MHQASTRPGGSHAARTGKKRPEFQALTRYVFPGGELDYLGRTITNLELSGFEICDVECWREHHQRTTRLWHDRLLGRFDEATAAVGKTTSRVWLAYLAACSIAFERNNAGVYQTLAIKRSQRPERLASDTGALVSLRGRFAPVRLARGNPFWQAPPGHRRRGGDRPETSPYSGFYRNLEEGVVKSIVVTGVSTGIGRVRQSAGRQRIPRLWKCARTGRR